MCVRGGGALSEICDSCSVTEGRQNYPSSLHSSIIQFVLENVSALFLPPDTEGAREQELSCLQCEMCVCVLM